MIMNPFMITSNQSYGISINNLQNIYECESNEEQELKQKDNNTNEGADFTDKFEQYSREYDNIGKGIRSSDSALARMMGKKESLSSIVKRRRLIFSKDSLGTGASNKYEAKFTEYDYSPNEQHPLYTTESNQYGIINPSEETFTKVKYSRSQNFSNSFNRNMFRDLGLNTS